MSHGDDNLDNDSDKITGLFKNSEEIQELQPHEQGHDGDNNSLQSLTDSLFFITFVNEHFNEWETKNTVDTNNGNDINIIPEGHKIVKTIISNLSHFVE